VELLSSHQSGLPLNAPTNTLQKATSNVEKLCDVDTASFWVDLLTMSADLPGAQRKLSRIAAAPSCEQVLDYLAEFRFAFIFLALDFEVELEPLGNFGPDLRVSRNGRAIMIEVTRFQKRYPGPPEFGDEDEFIAVYGNVRRDTNKAVCKIAGKFPQLGEHNAVIAVWNDDGDMEETHVLTAAHILREDSEAAVLRVPRGLGFVLYGSKWMRATGQQLYCYPVTRRMDPLCQTWMNELHATTVRQALYQARARFPQQLSEGDVNGLCRFGTEPIVAPPRHPAAVNR
jgi:hypothetical protein